MQAVTPGIINHRIIVLDASSSMEGLADDVVKVTDTQVAGLAEKSTLHDQETRISVFTFSSPQYHDHLPAKCLIYEKDVLRMPSIAGMYKPYGNTALCDALISVIADMRLTPEKHGDHGFWLDVVTDGYENSSIPNSILMLPEIIRKLPGNWTLAGFCPSQDSKRKLTYYGFPAGNISIWNPEEEGAVEAVGMAMAGATDTYMSMRTTGVRSTTSLYSMAAPRASDLKKSLTPVTPGSYYLLSVTAEDLAKIDNGRIDQFFQLKTGQSYTPGLCYYEMTKRERIQHYKKLAVAIYDKDSNSEQVYMGANARQMLGLPAESERLEVRVSPGSFKGYKVYILSTSLNRKLAVGSRLLVMR